MNAITFLITGLAYGGAEIQLVELATRLKARGWDVRIVSMLQPLAFVDDLESLGITVASLDMRRGIPNPLAIIKLIALLKRWKPDILHSHMVHANLLARISRLLHRVPVQVSTAHSINEGGHWRRIAYRITDPLCDLTTQVSNAGAEQYIKIKAVAKSKIRTVPNGVDVERFYRHNESREVLREHLGLQGSFTWLAVGRFEEAKDYPNLLKAFASIVNAQPDCTLLLVGHGPLRPRLESLIDGLKISEKVRFLGIRRDIPDLMSAVDAYVMSSAWEGMPIVLLEASAVGLPTVATDVGGNREVIINGQNGFLVQPGDSHELANAMLRLMSLAESERCCMGDRARVHVLENYSLDHIVGVWEDLYEELLGASE